MRQFKKKEEEEEEKEENKKEEEQTTKSKKNPKESTTSQPTSDMIEVPLDIPIRLKLELYDKEDNLIYETDFYNQITLHNMIFEGQPVTEQKGKKEKTKEKEEETETNKPYRLVCYLDESVSRTHLLHSNLAAEHFGLCLEHGDNGSGKEH